jgi:hypothetical protein
VTPTTREPTPQCANGCDAPVCPPSKVICRACLDKIGATLRGLLKEDSPPMPDNPSSRPTVAAWLRARINHWASVIDANPFTSGNDGVRDDAENHVEVLQAELEVALRAESAPVPDAGTPTDDPLNTPLTVEVRDGRLVIEIGIHALAHAVTQSDASNPFDDDKNEYLRTFAIADAVEFAQDVRRALTHEAEDGTTPLHTLLDEMAEEALNDGSLGLHDGDVAIPVGQFHKVETWSRQPRDPRVAAPETPDDENRIKVMVDGGMLTIDVVDASVADRIADAVKAFNAVLSGDPRVAAPVGEPQERATCAICGEPFTMENTGVKMFDGTHRHYVWCLNAAPAPAPPPTPLPHERCPACGGTTGAHTLDCPVERLL